MKSIIFFLLAIVAVHGVAQAQLSTKSKKAIEFYIEADNYRVRGQFREAIALLNLAIEKDDEFVEAYQRLGLVYFNMKQFDQAITQFEKGISLTTDVRKHKNVWVELGEAYLTKGRYEDAMKVLGAFVKTEVQNKQKVDHATALYKNAEFAFKNKDNLSAYQLRPLSDTVNCFAMQYFPVLTADQKQLIFTRRLRDDPNGDEDLVVSKKSSNGQWQKPVSISKNINTQLNEGTCTISADGRKLILTSCSGREGIGSCDLYESIKIGEEWSEPVNLGPNVNSPWWESQPSLSADGRTLYFISDRRAGLGGRDIWISQLGDNGKWEKAFNAGKPINSQFHEMSPFIHANNKVLYYSSNGLPGFGGFDIFFVERKDSAGWSAPQNFGAPVNTHEDQFSLFITADGNKAYYSQDEAGPITGSTKSMLFEVRIPEENQIKFRSNYVKGIVRDKKDRTPLRARIELINIEKNAVESLVESDSITGEYLIVLTQGADYALYVNKKQYLFKSLNFNYSEVKHFQPIVLDIDLEKAVAGSMVVLNNIFFEFDKFDLKDSSIPELNRILTFLKENPRVKVEIAGHTDNAGTAAYNRQLSLKRAQSVFNYLVEKGVAKARLVPMGYGPDRPLAPNDSEDNKKLNRRIEFKLLP